MTAREKEALKTTADMIRKLTSLERASFCFDRKEDEAIKEKIRPWMIWFEIAAMHIDDVVEISDESSRWYKQNKLDEIIRLNPAGLRETLGERLLCPRP